MLDACSATGITHALATEYRWAPAVRAMKTLIDEGRIGDVRHVRAVFNLDYAIDENMPLLWRFRSALAGGGAVADTGYHVVDLLRFLLGEEVRSVSALTARFIDERPLAEVDVWDASRDLTREDRRAHGQVDVEDAGAALLAFDSGAYAVLETSRVATGRRLVLRVEIYGSSGALEWDVERVDELGVCFDDEPFVRGFRRVLVNQVHPGAKELLVAVGDGTGIGWLGLETAMWAEVLTAVAEGRPARASFEDGLRACEVVNAIYQAADSGRTVDLQVSANDVVQR
jgi:predicted dehydrogenase